MSKYKDELEQHLKRHIRLGFSPLLKLVNAEDEYSELIDKIIVAHMQRIEAYTQRACNEAKDEILDDLLEWHELWTSLHFEQFNWYGAVKALKIAKDHKKPFTTLNQTNSKGERDGRIAKEN